MDGVVAGSAVAGWGMGDAVDERKLTYEHRRSAVEQFAQLGRVSSHFICRRLHSLQPVLNFLCGRRVFGGRCSVDGGRELSRFINRM